ncbi:Proline porter II [Ruegeria denitrificans]|uniref:Proline porter II n=1 Tax=Ruegeria denitrificans TaxID=1715692 RepID=A0A0P1IJR6_9RHOB|nr:MFS transporter [Ruegeria denitrificans]CUK17427.1 Proline porter II [Ruegeria denitrificans]
MKLSAKIPKHINLSAATVGNVLEWYDFAIYGFLAAIIGKHFFPADDPTASLLASFGVFALGFLARPLGGVLFGHIGDKISRKTSMLISISLMGGGTFAIGILPDVSQIGDTAAFLLVAVRIAQGLSMGGEYTGSAVYLAESAPAKHRGFIGCWPQVGCLLGVLLGSGCAALTSTIVGETAMQLWGWRVPFLLGGLIAVWGLLMRRQMEEPKVLGASERVPGSPFFVVMKYHWRPVLRLVCLLLVTSIGYYMQFVYAVSFLSEKMHISTAASMDINTLAIFTMLAVTLPAGWLADRLGRKPMLAFVAVGSIAFAWPLWWLIHHQSFAFILIGQCGFGILYGVGFAVTMSTMVEMFPAPVRCSGTAIGFNLCLGLFGGTTPFVVTYLVARTSDDFVPAYALMAAGFLSLLALYRLPESAGKPLPK